MYFDARLDYNEENGFIARIKSRGCKIAYAPELFFITEEKILKAISNRFSVLVFSG